MKDLLKNHLNGKRLRSKLLLIRSEVRVDLQLGIQLSIARYPLRKLYSWSLIELFSFTKVLLLCRWTNWAKLRAVISEWSSVKNWSRPTSTCPTFSRISVCKTCWWLCLTSTLLTSTCTRWRHRLARIRSTWVIWTTTPRDRSLRAWNHCTKPWKTTII